MTILVSPRKQGVATLLLRLAHSAMSNQSKRGFGTMDRVKRREIASKGGKAAHARGTAHQFTPERAREAAARRRRRAAGVDGALHLSTMCVVDDEDKTFEFRFSIRTTDLVRKASAAIARGRKVRCYTMRDGEQELEREDRFLVSRGYTRDEVKL